MYLFYLKLLVTCIIYKPVQGMSSISCGGIELFSAENWFYSLTYDLSLIRWTHSIARTKHTHAVHNKDKYNPG